MGGDGRSPHADDYHRSRALAHEIRRLADGLETDDRRSATLKVGELKTLADAQGVDYDDDDNGAKIRAKMIRDIPEMDERPGHADLDYLAPVWGGFRIREKERLLDAIRDKTE